MYAHESKHPRVLEQCKCNLNGFLMSPQITPFPITYCFCKKKKKRIFNRKANKVKEFSEKFKLKKSCYRSQVCDPQVLSYH